MRVDAPAWLCAQAAPGRLMVQQGLRPTVCPGPEVWGVPPGPQLYEFPGRMACGPRFGAAEAGARFRSSSEATFPGPSLALQRSPKLVLPEDVPAIEKELQQLAKELRRKRMSLGYSQADVGLAAGALFGNVLSQTTVARFEAQQLSLANMWKLRPLLKTWLEEMDEENFLGVCKMELMLQQARRRRRASRERRIGNDLERLFLRCPKPTPQQISRIAGDLGLRKEVGRVWFYNRRSKMCSRPTTDAFPWEAVGAAGPPCPGVPVCFPLAPGLHFDVPHYGGCCFTPLYSPAPFSAGVALLSAPAAALGLPRLSS